MKDTSRIGRKIPGKLSSTDASRDVQREEMSETAECAASLSDLRLKLRKKEASKPMYLTRYE